MPELPEVETVCRGISPHLEGASIRRAKVFNRKLRIPIPQGLEKKIQGLKISKVERKAKYILIYLEESLVLVIHLGMSGRLKIQEEQEPNLKHDHVLIELDNGARMVFNDTRKFGLFTLLEEAKMHEFKFFQKLGFEPLSKDFTAKKLFEISQKRNKNIKSVIMDSSILVGVGNIYACESLFQAGIHPERIANTLNQAEAKKLYRAIVSTLKRAIKAGGSTLKDYAKADGEAGYFQHQFLVYAREDEACLECETEILRIKQNGRSSFLCPCCQG